MAGNASMSAILVPALVAVFGATVPALAAGDSRAVKELPIPAHGEAIDLRARCGEVKSGLKARFVDTAGKGDFEFVVECVDLPDLNHHWSTSNVPKECRADAGLLLKFLRLPGSNRPWSRYYAIRPDIHFYYGADLVKAQAEWLRFPPASAHVFQMRMVRNGGRLEVWIDGRFFAAADVQESWASVKFAVLGQTEILSAEATVAAPTGPYLPLDISHTASQGGHSVASVTPGAGVQKVAGVPFHVVPPGKHVDVGLSRWLRQEQDSDNFYSPYYKRSAWDNVPETIIFSVPKKYYRQAHVLCALSPRTGRAPAMTVRVARYRQVWDGAGSTQGDTDVLVDPAGGDSVKEIGSVQVDVEGKQTRLPLYLVTIPLRTSELADYLSTTGFDGNEKADSLSLEFCRTLKTRVTRNYGVFEKMPLGEQSGLLLFGVTLEEAPLEVSVASASPGNVFHNGHPPKLTLRFHNPASESMAIEAQACFRDFFGKTQDRKVPLRVAPGTSEVPFDIGFLGVGWYEADFSFRGSAGADLWRQTVTCAILPTDTRTAGPESPFGIWWFVGEHNCEGRAERVLPLIRGLGFRHVNLAAPLDKKKRDYGLTPELLASYKIDSSMLGYVRNRGEKDFQTTIADTAAQFVKEFPTTRYAMIFHESGISGLKNEIPPEILGRTFEKLEGKDLAQEKDRYAQALAYARTLRAAAPNLKIMLGNGGTDFNMHWMRLGFPRELYDCIGMETAIQSFCPEAQPTPWNLQSLWIAKRMREIYRYDIPITSCYEFDYRCTAPGALSLERQANWYVRDLLHCLAYRMPSINVALIMDCDSAYYTSRWGSSGLCFRAPLMMPKPGYVAVATLTRVLDGAEFKRAVNVDSTGTYCLEFAKGERRLYALWNVRGARTARLVFPAGTGSCTSIDIMGNERALQVDADGLRVDLSESPLYLSADAPVKAVSLEAPSDAGMALIDEQRVTEFKSAAKWRIQPQGDQDFETYCSYLPMCKGAISLADADGGMRVALATQPEQPDIVARYAILRPTDGPIPIPGKPEALALRIKGNSGWGRVVLEITDAKGRRWSSNGWEEAPRSWDMGDWEGDSYVNFDGWRTITIELPRWYPSEHYQPSFRNWRCHGDNSTKNRIAFPITLSGLYVVMRERVVYVTDMVPARSPGIQIRDLKAGRLVGTE